MYTIISLQNAQFLDVYSEVSVLQRWSQTLCGFRIMATGASIKDLSNGSILKAYYLPVITRLC